MSTVNKILALAFHPSTPEPEATVAFLKAKRAIPLGSEYTTFFRLPVQEVKESKQEMVWNLTIKTKSVPLLLHSFYLYSKEPFYTFHVTQDSWHAAGTVKVKLAVYLPQSQMQKFCDLFDDIWETITTA